MELPSTPTPNMLSSVSPKRSKRLLVIVLSVSFFLAVVVGVGVAYGQSFRDRVLPGTMLGTFAIGGMGQEELALFIEDMHGKLLEKGVPVTFRATTTTGDFVLYLQTIGDDAVHEFVVLDPATIATRLVLDRKTGNPVRDTFITLHSLVTRPNVSIDEITYQRESILTELNRSIAPYITPVVNAGISISDLSPFTATITTSSPGTFFDYDSIFDEITRAWAVLEQPQIHIETRETNPTIVESDIERMIPLLPPVFDAGGIDITYTNSSTKRTYNWAITPLLISRWIEVTKDDEGVLGFGLSASSTAAYLRTTVAPTIDIEPQDALFNISDDGWVTEFKGSHPGVTVDIEQTYQEIVRVFADRIASTTAPESTVTVFTKEVLPKIQTGEVNDLGITEVLGVGHSVFKGSPGNRYKNIRLAAFQKLHGLLIEPGENFSLLEALKPFTLEGGYLPELAIKGDKLEPEIGGGLCQIGTTMFRAAMNAGLEITERRNHSLMVSYYNDLSNGNPGTDATIYDPGTDFRFRNDTGHHILITSELNDKTGDLFFTLWGTSDGRKGYYIPPKVSKWIPTGPTRVIETTNLPPGKRECQHAFTGAVASFTYIREMPNGEKKEVVYDSYYRPLPEICLVGVAAPSDTTPSDDTLRDDVSPDGTGGAEVGSTDLLPGWGDGTSTSTLF
jgi:vancomycin resistance protein YoaR